MNKVDLTNKKFGNLIALEPTQNRDSIGSIIWKCKCNCGNKVLVSARCLTQHNTTSCGCLKSSIGEDHIEEFLLNNKINYIKEYTRPEWIFQDSKSQGRFDFYLPDYNILIEFDGIQHYREVSGWTYSLKRVQQHDKIKNNWAAQSHLKLIRIPYWERDNISLKLPLSSNCTMGED